jgi:hypothetical protein
LLSAEDDCFEFGPSALIGANSLHYVLAICLAFQNGRDLCPAGMLVSTCEMKGAVSRRDTRISHQFNAAAAAVNLWCPPPLFLVERGVSEHRCGSYYDRAAQGI